MWYNLSDVAINLHSLNFYIQFWMISLSNLETKMYFCKEHEMFTDRIHIADVFPSAEGIFARDITQTGIDRFLYAGRIIQTSTLTTLQLNTSSH